MLRDENMMGQFAVVDQPPPELYLKSTSGVNRAVTFRVKGKRHDEEHFIDAVIVSVDEELAASSNGTQFRGVVRFNVQPTASMLFQKGPSQVYYSWCSPPIKGTKRRAQGVVATLTVTTWKPPVPAPKAP